MQLQCAHYKLELVVAVILVKGDRAIEASFVIYLRYLIKFGTHL